MIAWLYRRRPHQLSEVLRDHSWGFRFEGSPRGLEYLIPLRHRVAAITLVSGEGFDAPRHLSATAEPFLRRCRAFLEQFDRASSFQVWGGVLYPPKDVGRHNQSGGGV